MEHTTPQDQPQQPKRFQCRHIFTDGHRCGSAALRNEDFCYYHHTTRRPAANPRARRARRAAFNLPLPEDRSAIQASIGQVLQRIAANDLDPRRAGLLLYGLQIAALNLPKQQPLQPENEKPHEAIVEQIEIHPELGPLAPQAEAPHPYRLTRQHILEYKIREADEMREKLFKKERELKDKENEFGIMQGRVIVMEAELRKLKSAAPQPHGPPIPSQPSCPRSKPSPRMHRYQNPVRTDARDGNVYRPHFHSAYRLHFHSAAKRRNLLFLACRMPNHASHRRIGHLRKARTASR